MGGVKGINLAVEIVLSYDGLRLKKCFVLPKIFDLKSLFKSDPIQEEVHMQLICASVDKLSSLSTWFKTEGNIPTEGKWGLKGLNHPVQVWPVQTIGGLKYEARFVEPVSPLMKEEVHHPWVPASLSKKRFSGDEVFCGSYVGPACARGNTQAEALFELQEKLLDHAVFFLNKNGAPASTSWVKPSLLAIEDERWQQAMNPEIPSVCQVKKITPDIIEGHWLSDVPEDYILVMVDRKVDGPYRFAVTLAFDGFLSQTIESTFWPKVESSQMGSIATVFGRGATPFEAFCALSEQVALKGLVSRWSQGNGMSWHGVYLTQTWTQQTLKHS